MKHLAFHNFLSLQWGNHNLKEKCNKMSNLACPRDQQKLEDYNEQHEVAYGEDYLGCLLFNTDYIRFMEFSLFRKCLLTAWNIFPVG